MIHVAILLKPYLDLLLAGKKHVECRLTQSAQVPYEAIAAGERVYFKQSSGPFRATAIADHVLFAKDLTPRRVGELKRDYNDSIRGEDHFWQLKRNARYATLIWLSDLEPAEFGPRIRPQQGKAWKCLPDTDDVYPQCVFDQARIASSSVVLTGGNLRHSHMSVRRILSLFPKNALGGRTKAEAGVPITLSLQSGVEFKSDIVAHNGLVRSRRYWTSWYEQRQAQPGDRVAFIPGGKRKFDVCLIRKSDLPPDLVA